MGTKGVLERGSTYDHDQETECFERRSGTGQNKTGLLGEKRWQKSKLKMVFQEIETIVLGVCERVRKANAQLLELQKGSACDVSKHISIVPISHVF